MRNFSLVASFVIAAQSTWAQTQPESSQKELAKLRHSHMVKIANAYKGKRDHDEAAISPIDRPLLKWSNQGQIDAGLLVGWEDEKGVPVAIAQFWLTPDKSRPIEGLTMELQSLSQEAFELRLNGKWPWNPTGRGITWKEFPGKSVKPAKSKALRLAQMRSLARRFTGYNKAGKREIQLRLLTEPVHRYSHEESGLLDGAVFIATFRGTDPELILMVECRDEPPTYRYALARMTGYGLHISFDRKEVWKQPPNKSVSPVNDLFVLRGGPPLVLPERHPVTGD